MVNSPIAKIGVLYSESGPMAANGKHLINATKIAVDEINQNGGLFGYSIEMIVEDGKSTPAIFASKAKKLIQEDGVVAIFGCWTSSARKAVKPVVEENQTLLWYPLQYEGLEESPNIFYTGCSLNQQVEPVIEWTKAENKKTCILLGSDYVYPRIANQLIRSSFTNIGGKILAERYYPLKAEDFSEVISEIKDLQPDIIFNTLNGSGNILFFRQLSQSGFDSLAHPIMSFSFSEIELNMLANEAEGSFACWSYFQGMSNPENEKFLKYLSKCYGETYISADPIVSAYSQVHLWKQVVIAANSFDTEKVQKSAIGQSFQSPGGLLAIQPNHHTRKHVSIARVITDNRFEVVWQSIRPIDAKPWLSIEDMHFPNKQLVLEIMEAYPEAIHSNWRLELEINKRRQMESELKNAMDQSKKAIEAKNNFITNLSHEIRTPMNAILGFIHLLKDRATDPNILDTLRQMQISANSLMALVNTIFDYSKMQADSLELIEEQFNIYDLISILKQTFSGKAQKKKLDLEFLIDEGINKVLIGDSVKLLQVLREMLDNAIKFTKNGSVTFSMKLARVKKESVIIAFSISDTGIGISKEQIDHIFKHATQADDSLDREFGGIGLNLKLIKEMIVLMGGRLQIESKPGIGSTFSFQLAFKKPEKYSEKVLEPNLEDFHVLAVEDSEINQLITKQILENHNIHVSVANNGLVAVEMAKANQFDAILMDIQMPIMDGYQAAREIRKIEQCAGIPILALTANAMLDEIKEIKAAGMQAYISKPINADALIATLKHWVSQKQISTIHIEGLIKRDVLEIAGLDSDEGLKRVNGNMALYQSLLFTFSDQYAKFDVELDEAINNDDYKNAIYLTHTLKGVAGNVGARSVFERSKILEAALKSGEEKGSIHSECRALYLKLSEVVKAIDEYRNHLLTQQPVPIKKERKSQVPIKINKKLEPQLKELYRLLVAGSTDSISVLKEIKKNSGGVLDQSSLYEIEKYIKTYDFETAVAKIKVLLQDSDIEIDQL